MTAEVQERPVYGDPDQPVEHDRAGVRRRETHITAEQMHEAGKLLGVSAVRELLRPGDDVAHLPLAMNGHTSFHLRDDWFVNLDGKAGDAPVNAWVTTLNPAQGQEKAEGTWHEYQDGSGGLCTRLGERGACGADGGDEVHRPRHGEGVLVQLTKDAVLELCSDVGLPKTYVVKTPPRLINPQLDYWYDSPDRQAKLFVSEGLGKGVAKATLNPFSNVRLLDRALAAVEQRFGVEEDRVYVDTKMGHSLKSTSLLLVIPDSARAMRPDDHWSGGVQLRNSLLGDHPTTVNSYLFRWWCTNGAITKGAGTGQFSRRGSGDREEVYDWVGRAVDESLQALESEFDRVEAMTREPIQGEVRHAIDGIADRYKLSSAVRQAIANEMMETPDVTMYGLMNAVTRAAQARGVSAALREQLMTIGGDFVYGAGRCGECHSVVVADHG